MVSFVNSARIVVICVGFHLGTSHGYFFHKDFWPNLNFPLEYQIKLVLICMRVYSVISIQFCYSFNAQTYSKFIQIYINVKTI